MSYDLYLSTQRPADEVRAWFDRRGYTLEGDQATREDEGGAYVLFELREGEGGGCDVAFNLNYFRPTFFGLAAEPELTAFVEAFQPRVDDPQSEGMGQGPYTPEGFLRGWNAGNRFAVDVILQQQPEAAASARWLPGATLTATWRWMTMREAYIDLLGSIEMIACFVPSILLLEVDGVMSTGIVWGSDVGIAFPEGIDWVLSLEEGEETPRWLRAETLHPLMEGLERLPADGDFELDGDTRPFGFAHWLVEAPVPDAIRAALAAADHHPGEVERHGGWAVLDSELRPV